MSQQKTWACPICGKTTKETGVRLLGATKKMCLSFHNRVGSEMERAGLITKASWGGWNWEKLPPQLQVTE